MNKAQAEAWVKELTDLLAGKELITVAVTPIGHKVEVRQHQEFSKAYFVEHADGSCVVALCDSYGVMTGADNWQIDADKRTVLCHLKNGYNEDLHYTWTIVDPMENGSLWQQMREAQERLWRVK